MRISLLLTLGLLPVFFVCPAQTFETELLQKNADALLKDFSFDSAAFNYLILANTYHKAGDKLSSAKYCRKAGETYLANGDLSKAEYELQQAEEIVRVQFSLSDTDQYLEKLDLVNSLMELRIRQGKYSEANDLYQQAVTLYTIGNKLAENRKAKFYEKTGYLNMVTGNYTAATQFLDSAFYLNKQLYQSNAIEWVDLYFALGLMSRLQGDLDQAFKYCLQADTVLMQQMMPDLPRLAKLYHNQGIILENKSELIAARGYFEKCLELTLSIYGPDHPYLGSLYNNYAIVYGKSGRYDIAQELNFRALDITLKYYGGEYYDVAGTYNNIGFGYMKMGRYDEAIEYYEKALRIKTRIFGDAHEEIALTSNNIADVFLEKGDYAKAKMYFEKSLTINLAVFGEQSNDVAENYAVLSKIYLHEADYDNALKYINKALNIRKDLNGLLYPDVAECFSRRSAIYVRQENLNLAIHDLDSSIYIYKLCYHEKHPELTEAYISLATYYSMLGEYDNALASAQKALITNSYYFTDTCIYKNPEDSSVIRPSLFLQTLTCKADLFYKLYSLKPSDVLLENSLAVYEKINEFVNRMRNSYRFEASRLFLSQITKESYKKAIETAYVYYQLHTTSENARRVFSFIENAKSATLSLQANENEALLFSGIPDSLKQKEHETAARLSMCNTEIEKLRAGKITAENPELISYLNQRFDLTRSYDSLISAFEHNYPAYKTIKYACSSVDPGVISKALGPDDLVLDYYVGDSALYNAVINDSTFFIIRTRIKDIFKNQVMNYYAGLRKADPDSFINLSHSLYEMLIGPAESCLHNKKKLIILPDDFLYYLPFETLLTETNEMNDLDFSKASFLIKKYSLVYHQSLTLWYNTRTRMKTGKGTNRQNLVAFAPVFGEDTSEFASETYAEQSEYCNLLTRADVDGNNNFIALPYSMEEVISIVITFQQRNVEAKGFLFTAATEANFTRYAGNYDIVHISSHGITDTIHSDLSGIAFSKPAGNDSTLLLSEDDGILYLGEIHKLNLNARLLVISSCESGMGKMMIGEGIKSMTRGFLYLNTPNIIYSLWNVLDKSTKELMISFYESILNGNSYSGALRDAKLKMIENPETSFPFFWGGFVLTGN
jgi:CHAT domain-containing protein